MQEIQPRQKLTNQRATCYEYTCHRYRRLFAAFDCFSLGFSEVQKWSQLVGVLEVELVSLAIDNLNEYIPTS
jgi:hypothetical protein